MYDIWYTVVCYTYGNVSGCCGDFDNVVDAIDRCYELGLEKQQGESFGVTVCWEVNENV